MKKLLLISGCIIAALTLIIASGCDGNPVDKKDPETEVIPEFDTSKEITVTYYHANGAALTTVLNKIIEAFEAEYTNITIDAISYGSYTTLRDTIGGAVAAGTTPTAAQTYPDHVAVYNDAGALVSLDAYVNDSRYGLSQDELSQFLPGFLAEGTIYDAKGTRYALPFNKSTEIMYYNEDIFAKYSWKVPTTWDEVVEVAEAWKATDEYKAVSTNYKGLVAGMSYDSEANLFITLTQQWGGEYTKFGTDGKGLFASFGQVEEDMAKSKTALNWYLDQYKAGNIATTGYFGTDYSSDAFKNGQCIMTIGSSAGSSYNNGQESTATKFTTGVAAYPQKDLTDGQVIQQGTNVSLFKCNDKQEQLAGWLWLKYMVSYQSALTWALETSYFPIRYDVLNSNEYQDHIKGIQRDKEGNEVGRNLTLSAKAKAAGLDQKDWFYTNVAFFGSSVARDEAEALVRAVLYGDTTIDAAYANALRIAENQ